MNSMTPLLNVEDASRSLGFYRDNLGFRVDEDFEHEGKLVWARISLGPIALMINTSEERTARGARSSRGPTTTQFSISRWTTLGRCGRNWRRGVAIPDRWHGRNTESMSSRCGIRMDTNWLLAARFQLAAR